MSKARQSVVVQAQPRVSTVAKIDDVVDRPPVIQATTRLSRVQFVPQTQWQPPKVPVIKNPNLCKLRWFCVASVIMNLIYFPLSCFEAAFHTVQIQIARQKKEVALLEELAFVTSVIICCFCVIGVIIDTILGCIVNTLHSNLYPLKIWNFFYGIFIAFNIAQMFFNALELLGKETGENKKITIPDEYFIYYNISAATLAIGLIFIGIHCVLVYYANLYKSDLKPTIDSPNRDLNGRIIPQYPVGSSPSNKSTRNTQYYNSSNVYPKVKIIK